MTMRLISKTMKTLTKHDDEHDYFDDDCDRLRDYLKLEIEKIQLKTNETTSGNIRLSFDEVDNRCRRVLNDGPGRVPLST